MPTEENSHLLLPSYFTPVIRDRAPSEPISAPIDKIQSKSAKGVMEKMSIAEFTSPIDSVDDAQENPTVAALIKLDEELAGLQLSMNKPRATNSWRCGEVRSFIESKLSTDIFSPRDLLAIRQALVTVDNLVSVLAEKQTGEDGYKTQRMLEQSLLMLHNVCALTLQQIQKTPDQK